MASTGSRLDTWVLTMAAEASQFTWAVSVHRAFRLILLHDDLTLDVRIAIVPGRAAARRNVVIHTTFGVDATIARILALLVSARQSVWAVIVDCTLGPVAAYQRIATVSVQAEAARMMIIVGLAHCIRSALSVQARVNTLAIDAG